MEATSPTCSAVAPADPRAEPRAGDRAPATRRFNSVGAASGVAMELAPQERTQP